MRRKPMMMPTTMRRHDSGKMFGNLGVMWNPERMKKKEIGHQMTHTMDSFISTWNRIMDCSCSDIQGDQSY